MRQEILGFERRRRWSDDEKLKIVEEVGLGGLRVADVARRHDLTRQHLYQWRRQLRQKGLVQMERAVLVPVEVSIQAASPPIPAYEPSRVDRIEIVLGNGRIVRVGIDVAELGLVRLIKILEAA